MGLPPQPRILCLICAGKGQIDRGKYGIEHCKECDGRGSVREWPPQEKKVDSLYPIKSEEYKILQRRLDDAYKVIDDLAARIRRLERKEKKVT